MLQDTVTKSTSLHQPQNNAGMSLVEMIVVASIAALVFVGLSQAETLALRLLRAERQNLEATLLAGEALEAVRAVRDESWANISSLATDGTLYYPLIENGKWAATTTAPSLINGMYTRSLLFNQVSRDAQDRIAVSGANDPSTRKATARVSWNGGVKSVEFVTYITDFQASLSVPAETKSTFYDNASTETNLANFPSPNAGDGDPAQSFTSSGSTMKVSRVDLLLRRDTPTFPSDVYVELRSSPTSSAAVLGVSQQLDATTITSAGASWVSFRFQNPVILAPSTVYYLRLRSVPGSTDAGSGSAGLLYWRYTQVAGGGSYSGGAARRYVGRLSNPSDEGDLLSNDYDFGFRVYTIP